MHINMHLGRSGMAWQGAEFVAYDKEQGRNEFLFILTNFLNWSLHQRAWASWGSAEREIRLEGIFLNTNILFA